jgi:hypothetical protein
MEKNKFIENINVLRILDNLNEIKELKDEEFKAIAEVIGQKINENQLYSFFEILLKKRFEMKELENRDLINGYLGLKIKLRNKNDLYNSAIYFRNVLIKETNEPAHEFAKRHLEQAKKIYEKEIIPEIKKDEKDYNNWLNNMRPDLKWLFDILKK